MTEYTYETCEDGYAIYDPEGNRIDPWILVKELNVKCARCDAQEVHDFGEDTLFYVESLQSGKRRKARYLCSECLGWLNSQIEKFLDHQLNFELTPREKEIRSYFVSND